jgi:hypothetical protein
MYAAAILLNAAGDGPSDVGFVSNTGQMQHVTRPQSQAFACCS